MKKFLLPLLLLSSALNAKTIEDIEAEARNGNVESQFRAGLVYEFGKKVPSDHQMAEYWYQKADKNGNIKASARLGYMSFEQKDYSAAKKYFYKGLDKENRFPYSVLFYGKILRIEGNDKDGLALIKSAAKSGVPQAMHEWAYYNGIEKKDENYYLAYIYSKMAEIKKYKEAKKYTRKYKEKLTSNQLKSADLNIKKTIKKEKK